MKLVEISNEEWLELEKSRPSYFLNGCMFDEETDNLMAFCWYVGVPVPAYKHYKVVNGRRMKEDVEEILDRIKDVCVGIVCLCATIGFVIFTIVMVYELLK